MAARRLTVEDTAAAYWYCLRRGALASAPATTAANLNSNLREPFAPAAALLEGGPTRPPALRRTAHLDSTTAGPLDYKILEFSVTLLKRQAQRQNCTAILWNKFMTRTTQQTIMRRVGL